MTQCEEAQEGETDTSDMMVEDDENDRDWSIKAESNERFKGRCQREWKVEILLGKSDQELFESMEVTENDIKLLQSNPRFKARREQYGQMVCETMTDQELFMGSSDVNKHVTETDIFQSRKKSFCGGLLDGETSQDILFRESETPQVVIESADFHNRLKHLTKRDKSELVSMQEVRKTVQLLGQASGQEAKDQIKIIAASMTSEKYGVPELGLNWREEKLASEMKTRLLSGQDKVLTVPKKAVRQVLPLPVAEVAVKYWEQTTTVEPAKHRRLSKVVMDGEEALPTRYQTTTDDEAYQGFKVKRYGRL